MSGELARRVNDRPLTRAAARALGKLQDAALLQQAEIDNEENAAAYLAAKRIENSYVLANHLIDKAGQLNQAVTATAQNNPGLELMLRGVEEDLIIGSRLMLRGYMGRS